MRKINLVINGRKYFLSGREHELLTEVALLSASERRYENFTLYAQRPGFLTSEELKLLKSRRGKWKNVKIWSEKFVNEDQLEDLLRCVNENVENLEFKNISFIETNKKMKTEKKISCAKLRTLSLCNVINDRWYFNSLYRCDRLEILEVENVDDDSLIDFLRNLKSLKRLSIASAKWNDDFFQKLSKLSSLKLGEFKIKARTSHFPVNQTGLKRFLESQAENMTKVTFDVPLNNEVRQTIFNFPNLNIL